MIYLSQGTNKILECRIYIYLRVLIRFLLCQCVSEPPRGRVSAELSKPVDLRALCALYLYRSLDGKDISLHN